MVRRENFPLPPPSPTFPGKNFRCPFQYPKVTLEAGASPQSFGASYAPGEALFFPDKVGEGGGQKIFRTIILNKKRLKQIFGTVTCKIP